MPSSLGLTSPDRDQRQGGRRSASRISVDQLKQPVLRHDGPHHQLIKAARKTSALHVAQGSPELLLLDVSEGESDSEEASVATSSLSPSDTDKGHSDHGTTEPGPNGEILGRRSSSHRNDLTVEHDGTSSDSSESWYSARAADEDDNKLKDTPPSAATFKVRSSDHFSRNRSRSIDSPISPVFPTRNSLPREASASPRAERVFPGSSKTRGPSALAGDEEADPPAPLINAFENLSTYTLHLHRVNRLPFLLRNVRRSFRTWCRELHIQSDIDASLQNRPQVSLTYRYTTAKESYTYNTTIQERECPICSIFAVFPSWQTLEKHMRWDHPEVEFVTRPNENVPTEMNSIVVEMKEVTR